MIKFLTVIETADFLRVHPSTIYRWVSTLEIPHSKVMGRILFKESDLVEWVSTFSHSIETNHNLLAEKRA